MNEPPSRVSDEEEQKKISDSPSSNRDPEDEDYLMIEAWKEEGRGPIY